MNKQFKIGNKLVGENAPAFIVAEISGNHNQDYHRCGYAGSRSRCHRPDHGGAIHHSDALRENQFTEVFP